MKRFEKQKIVCNIKEFSNISLMCFNAGNNFEYLWTKVLLIVDYNATVMSF